MAGEQRRPIVDLTEAEARLKLPLKWHVRLNIATSPDRLTEIVERLAKAWV